MNDEQNKREIDRYVAEILSLGQARYRSEISHPKMARTLRRIGDEIHEKYDPTGEDEQFVRPLIIDFVKNMRMQFEQLGNGTSIPEAIVVSSAFMLTAQAIGIGSFVYPTKTFIELLLQFVIPTIDEEQHLQEMHEQIAFLLDELIKIGKEYKSESLLDWCQQHLYINKTLTIQQ